MNDCKRNAVARRTGAALLLLVAAVMFVVLFAGQSLVTGTLRTQVGSVERERMQMLQSAITMSADLEASDLQSTIRLPIDDDQQWIELSLNADGSIVTAMWQRDSATLAQMSRERTPRIVKEDP